MIVDLGMPGLCPELNVLSPRKRARQTQVGSVVVGGDVPISVRSMTVTKTHDIGSTLQQIAELTTAGYDIVRVACPMDKDAFALKVTVQQSRIPAIADIHSQPKYIFAVTEAGCGTIWVNPGNIRKFDDKVIGIYKVALDCGVSLRIGINTGSLDPRLLKKYGSAAPEVPVESAAWEAFPFEECGSRDFKISAKHHNAVTMMRAYQAFAEQGDWPLYPGVTEADSAFQGTVKPTAAFGTLPMQRAGDTICVSLSVPPAEEMKVGSKLLEFTGLHPRKLEIVFCPSCGRAQVDTWTLAEPIEEGLKDVKASLRMAVMDCVVNGSGEAHGTDPGCASGNGKGQIFVYGQMVEMVPEDQVVETLLKYVNEVAEEVGEVTEGDKPVVQTF